MTGPVGRPVGEPPAGSTEIASIAPDFNCAASGIGKVIRIGRFGCMTPTGIGLPPAGMIHSS